MNDNYDIEELARKFFPYPTPNPGQIEAIVQTIKNIINGDTHIIIEAPTGVGKSVIAATIHKVMRHIKPSFRTTIITATKGLQDQYTEDFKFVTDLKGKQNYHCLQGSDVGPYGSIQCKSKLRSGKCSMDICPYVKQRSVWCKEADFRITNNAFQIKAPPQLVMLPETKADLIICDESHELDETILDHTKLEFSAKDFVELGNLGKFNSQKRISQLPEIFKEIKFGEAFYPNKEQLQEIKAIHIECETLISEFESLIEEDPKVEGKYAPILEVLSELSDKLYIIYSTGEEGEWIKLEGKDGKLELKAVYASSVSHYGLFRKCEQFVHMSATICGTKEYARSLGLKNYSEVTIDNPIPVDNRKVFVISKHSLHKYFKDWDSYFGLMNSVLKKHKNERGLIHTVSFDLANRIKDSLPEEQRERILVSNNRREIMEYIRSRPDAIIASPSIEKGYDFKGDLARFQIIAKIPYGFLGDPHIRLNTERSDAWYARKSILRLVQACGRAVRGVDDHAKTYIMDAQILKLLTNHDTIFPDWFLDSLVILE